MKNLSSKLRSVAAMVAVGLLAFAGNAYSYTFSLNDGPAVEIDALSGTQSANQYYNYFGAKPHPAFGTEQNTAFFWIWEETDTGKVSLNVVFDGPGGAYGLGAANFTLSGMPAGWAWTLQDDNADIGNATDTTPTWYWNKQYGDGGVMGGLEDSSWEIDWLFDSGYGITNWYFLSGGDGKHDHAFALDAGDKLTVSNIPSVPEPSSLLLMSGALIGLGLARRKRRA